MFRLWCKLVDDDGHFIKDTTICNDDSSLNRTRKVFASLEAACYEFDLAQPVWLDANIKEFKQRSRVRFNQDNFMEEIDFRFMEIQVIEED